MFDVPEEAQTAEPAAAPAPATATDKTVAKIDDAGEKIGGSRKDRWKALDHKQRKPQLDR